MAVSGKRKKSKKPATKAARAVAKPKKIKKSAAPKKVKATPVKATKRPKKEEGVEAPDFISAKKEGFRSHS